MKTRLTDDFVRTLPVTGADYYAFDTVERGFFVRVAKDGAKLFYARARHNGRRPLLPLGTFPEKSVKTARGEAREALTAMRGGLDPMQDRKARQRAREAGQVTVSQFADRWLNEHVRPKLKPRSASDYETLVRKHIKPALGALTLAATSREDVLGLHASMKNIPVRANRTVSAIRALFSFAEDLELRAPGTNPAKRIKLYRERARERFLSEAEIGKAAAAIAGAERAKKIGPHAAAGLRLCLFTGARSGEIVAAKWSQVDWARSIIRLPDSKTNEPRTIHLSAAALEVLKSIDRVEPYIVAGTIKDEPFKNLKRSWIVARKFRGLDDVRLHDLRHSYASLAAGRGVSLQMIGKLLGHKVPATTQRYAHLTRDAASTVNDELGAAMLAAIEKPETQTGKIIKFRRKRRAT